jgi:hypothetical protein
MDVPSPNSLLDAEGDVDSSFGETFPEENTAEAQAADALCTMGGVNHQALASTVALGVSGPSLAEAAMISTPEQEPESRDDVQPTAEPRQLPTSPRRVVSATGQEGERNAQESDTQAVTSDLDTLVGSPIEADESMVDTDGIASADSSECRMDPETTPATSHTTSRHRDASRGRRSMTQESSGTATASFVPKFR